MSILYKSAKCATRESIKTVGLDLEMGRKGGRENGMEITGRTTLSIRKTRMVSDLSTILGYLAAAREMWDGKGIRKIVLCLSSSLTAQSDYIVRHVLHAVLDGLHGMSVIVTHTGDDIPLIRDIVGVANMVSGARLLSMKPANIATPAFTCKAICKWFADVSGVAIHRLSLRNLRSHKLNLITAVGASSSHAPCMLVVERKALRSAMTAKTVCLVGKGITFDTGGLALKSAEGMKDMKYDKVGGIYAAAVLRYICLNGLWKDVNFIGVFPFAENAIGNAAMHPGDIIKSHSGKTVEISDTDAEGRLLLADAMSYAARYKPDVLIDLATLTEHADFINCFHKGYFFVSPGSLRSKIENMTEAIGERMLAMPSWADFDHVLDSKVADLKNSPTECSDAYTAALFLKQFLPESVKTWLHIDLAHDVKDELPNGYGIRSTLRFLESIL